MIEYLGNILMGLMGVLGVAELALVGGIGL